MLEIKLKNVEISINGEVKQIPLNNLTTSIAFKLSDLSEKRKSLIEDIQSGKSDRNSEIFAMLDEMLSILIFEYDKYRPLIEMIPVENMEEFMADCLFAIQGGKKKATTPTKEKSTRSKTGLGSKATGSKKKK
jgi:hypothetical protein